MEILPIAYTGRLQPKRAFFRRKVGIHELEYRKGYGKLSFRRLKRLSKYPGQTCLIAGIHLSIKGLLK